MEKGSGIIFTTGGSKKDSIFFRPSPQKLVPQKLVPHKLVHKTVSILNDHSGYSLSGHSRPHSKNTSEHMQRVSGRKRLYQRADDENEVEDQLSDVNSGGSASGALRSMPTSDDEVGASRSMPTSSSPRAPPTTPTPIPMARSSGGRVGKQKEKAEMEGNGAAGGTAVSFKPSDDMEMEEGKDGGTFAGSATFVAEGLGKSFSQPFLGGHESHALCMLCYKDKDHCEGVTVKLGKDRSPTAIMVEHMQKHHKKEWTVVHTAQQKQQTMTNDTKNNWRDGSKGLKLIEKNPYNGTSYSKREIDCFTVVRENIN